MLIYLYSKDNVITESFRHLIPPGCRLASFSSASLPPLPSAEEDIPLFILSLDAPGLSDAMLKKIRNHPALYYAPVLLTGSTRPLNSIIDFIKRGADDFLDINNPRKMESTFTRFSYQTYKKQIQHTCKALLGSSLDIKRTLRKIAIYGPEKEPVLIVGETGTGKGLIAELLHQHSPRQETGTLISRNCSSFQENLFESAFAGTTAGAYTGAENKPGLLEITDGGTLFLDEIGDLSLGNQAQLLRFIENKPFLRLGGQKEKQTDNRFIFATNKDLGTMVKNKSFRRDLFYRCSPLIIKTQPLRERKEDILPLAENYIKKTCFKKRKNPMVLSDKAKNRLVNYYWPGNVRELENVLSRAIIENTTKIIDENCIHFNEEEDSLFMESSSAYDL